MGKALGRGLDSIKKKKTFKGLRALIRTSDEDEDTENPQESEYKEIKSEYNKKKRQLMDKRNLFYKLKQELVLHQLQEDADTQGEAADLKSLEDEIQSMERELDEILLNMSRMEKGLKTDDGQDLAIVRDSYAKRADVPVKEETPKESQKLQDEKEAIVKESVDTDALEKEIKADETLLLDILKESMVERAPVGEEPVIDDTEIEQAYERDEGEVMIYSHVETEEMGAAETDQTPTVELDDHFMEETDDLEEIEDVVLPDVPIPEYDEPARPRKELVEDLPEEPGEEEASPANDADDEPPVLEELPPEEDEDAPLKDEPETDPISEYPATQTEPVAEKAPDDLEDLPDVDIAELESVPIHDVTDEEMDADEDGDERLDPLLETEPDAEDELAELKHFKGIPSAPRREEVVETDVVEYDQDDIRSWKENEAPAEDPDDDGDHRTESYSLEPEKDTGIYEREFSHNKLYDDSKIKSKLSELKDIHDGLSQVDTEISKLQEQLEGMDEEAEYWEVLHEKGFALSRIGQYDEAIYFYDKALQLNPDNEEILSNKGVALFNLDQPEEAKMCFAQALKLRPTYEKAWNNLGVVMRAEGKLPEALRCYNQAIKANPFYKNAWYNKGFILEDMGELEEALKYYNKAIEISPNYAEAIYYRDECLAKLASKRLQEKEQLEMAYEEEIHELDRQLQDEIKDTFEQDAAIARKRPVPVGSVRADQSRDIPLRLPKKKAVKKKKVKRSG